MLECPVCHGSVPEVIGAPEQRCPHCGTVVMKEGGIRIPGATPDPGSRLAPARPAHEDDAEGADAAASLREGLYLWLQNIGPFTAFWLVPALVTAATTLVGYALGLTDVTRSWGESWAFYAISLPLGLLDFTVTLYFVGGAAAMVAESRDRGYPSLAHGYRVLGQQGERLLKVAAGVGCLTLMSLGLILLPITFLTYGDPSTTLGFILLVLLIFADIPGFLILYWFLFAVPIAALHPEWTPQRAFWESRAFARRYRTIGFTFTLVILLFAAVLVSFTFFRLLAMGLRFSGVENFPPALLEALMAFGASLLASCIPVVIATHYLRTGIGPASEAPAPAPAPEAPPAPKLRRVRCPTCSTPVVYEPGSGPVLVTCPTCGRQGTLR